MMASLVELQIQHSVTVLISTDCSELHSTEKQRKHTPGVSKRLADAFFAIVCGLLAADLYEARTE
jgi:hypothetical protein